MSFSRRAVLLDAALGATAATFAAALPMSAAIAQASLPRRRSVGELPLNDPILQTYRDGVRLLKAKANTDPTSWVRLASIHGSQGAFNRCPHGNWYFLPWHRAYLLTYERIIRAVTGNQNFALPYWDWTLDRQLPPAFTQQTFNGQPNPLFEPSRTMSADFSLPDNMVGPAVVEQIRTEPNFEIFASTRPTGQNSTDPSWVRRRGAKGPMESNPHDRVHGTVGGIMASGASPLDPIFLLHHCNLDRLWAVWNVARQNTGDALWLDMTFADFVAPNGTPMSWQVRSLRELAPLGYDYGLHPAPNRMPPALNPRLQSLLASLRRPPAGPIRFPIPPTPRPGPEPVPWATGRLNTRPTVDRQPLELSLGVDRRTIAQIARPRPTTGAGSSNLRFDRILPVQAPGQRRVLAVISDMVPPEAGNANARVFVNCDYLSVDTPTSDPHYVTSFGFFGGPHGEHGGSDGRVSLVIDLTPALRALSRLNRIASDDIRVQILPVPVPGRPADAVPAPFLPGRVDLAIV